MSIGNIERKKKKQTREFANYFLKIESTWSIVALAAEFITAARGEEIILQRLDI